MHSIARECLKHGAKEQQMAVTMTGSTLAFILEEAKAVTRTLGIDRFTPY
jgi:hypothetical protein